MKDKFPSGQFFIQLRYTDLVFDVTGASQEAGAEVILWRKKEDDNANQKWIYEHGCLKNVNSGLVLTADAFKPFVIVKQYPKNEAETQRYDYYDYTISAKKEDDYVLGILTSPSEGAKVALIPRDNDSELQQWEIVE